jgi:hypothetical protein
VAISMAPVAFLKPQATGAAQRNAQSTVQPRHHCPPNPQNFKVDFRKKHGSCGALDRPKLLRKLCSLDRSYLRPWGPKTLGSGKSLNSPCCLRFSCGDFGSEGRFLQKNVAAGRQPGAKFTKKTFNFYAMGRNQPHQTPWRAGLAP